jgi:hypothetical protein
MTFSGVMEQVMRILAAEESGSSSTPQPKCCRRYINRDRKVTHLRL